MVSGYRWSGFIRSLLPYAKVIAEDALGSRMLVWCWGEWKRQKRIKEKHVPCWGPASGKPRWALLWQMWNVSGNYSFSGPLSPFSLPNPHSPEIQHWKQGSTPNELDADWLTSKPFLSNPVERHRLRINTETNDYMHKYIGILPPTFVAIPSLCLCGCGCADMHVCIGVWLPEDSSECHSSDI